MQKRKFVICLPRLVVGEERTDKGLYWERKMESICICKIPGPNSSWHHSLPPSPHSSHLMEINDIYWIVRGPISFEAIKTGGDILEWK